MSQLENKVLLLARPESVYGQDSIAPALLAQPSAYQTDAMAVSNLDVRVNGEALTRENYSPSLSKERTGMGRMLLQLTFRTELKASGSLGVAPRIGRLLKAAGMAETIIAATAAATIGNPVQGATNSSAAMTAIATTSTDTTAPTKCFDTYRLTATTGGAPGAAKFIVTGAGFPDNDTAVMPSLSHTYSTNTINGVVAVGGTVVAPTFTFSGTWVKDEFVELFVGGVRFYYQVSTGDTPTLIATALLTAIKGDARFAASTSAAGVITVALAVGGAAAPGAGEFTSAAATQAVTLGQSGAVITLPAWTGNLVAGEFIDIPLLRPGVRYDPVSDNVTSLTFYVYLDGTLLKLTGSRGTFTVEGQSARYPVVNWTFTGIYNDPVDAALPTTAVYENSKPWKVELSQLAFYGVADNACASRFAFDMANTVEAKDCINASEGYDEIRITDRTPTCGADPESDKPSKMNPWWRVRREDTTRMHVAVGRRGGVGNIVRIQGDNANFRDVPFANRNRIRAYDFQMALARVTASGNDELFFHFS